MKVLFINAKDMSVEERELESHKDIRPLINGWIEAAYRYENGDVLYVDEEGLLKNPRHFFLIPERGDQPLAGNGVIVGREVEVEEDQIDKHPEGFYHLDVKTTISDLVGKLSFAFSPIW